MNSRYLQFLGLVGALAGAQLGCGDSTEDVVKGIAVGLDHMTQQAEIGPGALVSIHGTYGTNCVNRTGPWTALVGGGSVPDPLTVRTDNAACVLALTSVTMTSDPLVSLEASMAIPLAVGYATTAPRFPATGTLLFYANAALSPAGFGTDFAISVVYSDSEGAVEDLDNTGHPVTVHPITVTAGTVPAPAYALDVTGVVVRSDTASAQPVIVDVTGDGAVLFVAQDAQTGENYVIVDTLADHDYRTIDTAYKGGTIVPISAIPNSAVPDPIPSESFLLVPETSLPQHRFLIVAHTVEDVSSYEVFTINFLAGSECGNALTESGEKCDDGDVLPGDGCGPTCQFEECGNNVLDPGEECDDGNLLDTDTCSSTCQDIP